MSAALITTGIDRLVAEPAPHGGWRVHFRSVHEGLAHQLYVNGRLADWTDGPAQRCFSLDAPAAPLAILVAAVEAPYRATDLSGQLPPEQRDLSWVYRPRVVRSIAARRGDAVQVLGDHATGQLSPTPLAQKELWPAWSPRWAFGEDPFGLGGFGWDGASAPGLGMGAFGAGPFGMDSELVGLEAVLKEEGTHRIVLRTRGADGQVTDLQPVYVRAAPPAAPPTGLSVQGYDPQTKQLTLEIH